VSALTSTEAAGLEFAVGPPADREIGEHKQLPVPRPSGQSPLSPLLGRLNTLPWPEALSEYTNSLPYVPSGLPLCREMARRHAGIRLLLSANRRRSALVVDGGLGTTTIALAGEYQRVYALYTDADLLNVAKARIRHLGISNVQFVVTESLYDLQNFPDNLDCAVWTPVTNEPVPQLFLKLIFDRLGPEGTLFISLETGRHALSIRRRLWLYRFNQTLRQHFPEIRAFGYDRGLHDSFELRKLSAPTPAAVRMARLCTARAIGYVASKSPHTRSFLECIQYEVERSFGTPLRWEHIFFANPAGMTAIARRENTGDRIVVRVPLSMEAQAQHQRNYQNLRMLSSRAFNGFSTPRPIAYGEINGYSYSVETAVPGGNISPRQLRNDQNYRKILAAATTAILSLHLQTRRHRTLSADDFTRLVERPLSLASTVLNDQTGAQYLPRIEAAIRSGLQGAAIPLVFMHGDYTVDNVRLLNGAVSGVFDWDLGSPGGLPLLDLLYLIVSSELTRQHGNIAQAFARKCVLLNLDDSERTQVRRYCSALGIASDLVRPLALLTWIYHVGVRTLNPEPYNYWRTFWTSTLHAVANGPNSVPGGHKFL
jgi:aminoglycoside phosphotransferase (APT) family kinase protein/protein-L-isoaspartate O-methyltransferase